ncbi:MAG: hypothetical protein VX641_00940 [Planctomycetota bacterium]|nr:hypothetical protein [Planctomycetota bacterium]
MRFQFTRRCSLLLVLVVQPLAASWPADPAAVDRALVCSVRLLKPSGTGLRASQPVDLLIEDGRVARVGQDLIDQLEPGQIALRGRELWMIPAPGLRLSEHPVVSSDLVVAGLLGAGTVCVEAADDLHHHLIERARLDEIGFPMVVGCSEGASTFSGFELDPSVLSEVRLPSDPATVERLLRALDRGSSDPYLPGAPARFLVLESDPREDPSSLSDPFAVIQGNDLILKSERLVLLDEFAAFHALEVPTPKTLGWPDGPTSHRLYTLIVRGLPRGYVRVARWDQPDGSIVVRVSDRVAAPLTESFDATVSWPSGEVSCTWRVQSRSFTMNAGPAAGSAGQTLEITLNETPIRGNPFTLAPGDRFLPHSMLIAFDARADPSDGATRGLVEADVMGAPVRLERTDRRSLAPVSETTGTRLLEPEQIRALTGVHGGRLLSSSVPAVEIETQSSTASSNHLLLFEESDWPSWMMLSTPWGVVEWSSGALQRRIPTK